MFWLKSSLPLAGLSYIDELFKILPRRGRWHNRSVAKGVTEGYHPLNVTQTGLPLRLTAFDTYPFRGGSL
jgi:hypothetical protein